MNNIKTPKILYIITQGEYGGAQHYVLDLAENFKDSYDIVVAFGEKDKSHEFIKKLDEKNIKSHVLTKLKREIDLKQDFKAFIELRKLIRTEKPSIIHLNSSKISILASLASLGKNTKAVYTAHGWVFNEQLEKKKKLFYILAEKFTAMFKQKIICVSEFDRQTAINNNICKKSKLITIHNGIPDFELLSKDDARHEITKQQDNFQIFLNNNLVIGSIGYLYKNKGFDLLINACKKLLDKGINVTLIIIGGGPEEEALRDLIVQLRIEKNVHILGETKHASKLLRALDIYVCSSLKEGLSYTVIEAMTAGLPIVATDVGGNSELIATTKEGLIIEPNNVEEITKAIEKLTANPEIAQKMANAAHEKAINNFEIEQMIAKTGKVYKTVLNDKG